MMSAAAATPSGCPQHSLARSALLHILPGALTAAAFIALRPVIGAGGNPPLLAFLVAVVLVDLPAMIGIMLREGKLRNGRLSLDGVIGYRDKIGWKAFLLISVGAFVVIFALISAVGPINAWVTERLFSWLPDWMLLEEQSQYEAYGKGVLTAVFALQLVVTGLVLPWVEELYFRGFLLPRISRLGAWAPLIGGLLFALYHVWQLYGFVTVFILGMALGYLVWWKRDTRLSIVLHVLANAMARLAFLMAAMSM